MQADQRKSKRFDLRLHIELIRTGNEPINRVTETRNVSSGGVLFDSESQFPVGDPIEYFLTLPTNGKEGNNVRLHCMGTIIRTESSQKRNRKDKPFHVAATLERYEFVRPMR
ncbi:MAG: PilZ domain-containing protein [Bryobacterales bacterium]|nr:PilZ domain-containing protein [Bryobacterales bacterium]